MSNLNPFLQRPKMGSFGKMALFAHSDAGMLKGGQATAEQGGSV
jgi:hypothetical protein